jgi:hypothetical protein
MIALLSSLKQRCWKAREFWEVIFQFGLTASLKVGLESM